MRVEPLEGRCLLSGAGILVAAPAVAPGVGAVAAFVDRLAGVATGTAAVAATTRRKKTAA